MKIYGVHSYPVLCLLGAMTIATIATAQAQKPGGSSGIAWIHHAECDGKHPIDYCNIDPLNNARFNGYGPAATRSTSGTARGISSGPTAAQRAACEQMSVSSAKQSPAVDVCLPVWRNEKMSFHRHAKQWSRGKACDGIKRVGTLDFSPADRQRGNTMRSLLVALALSLSNGSMPALAAPSCQAWCTQNMCAHGGRSVSDCLSKCVPACQQKMSKGK